MLKAREVLVAVLCCGAVAPAYAGKGWKDSLKHSLETTYPITKQSVLAGTITRPGVVLVVKKEGITADKGTDSRYSVTKVHDGAIAQEGGAVGAIFTKKTSRAFKAGEKVFVTKIRVRKDGVMFLILSQEIYDVNDKGTTKPMRYKGAVKFEIPRDVIQTIDAATVKALVDPVLQPESEASAVQTKTIRLGQTRGEVEELIGRPERIVDLGPKVTYVYRDMKVIFTEGKVSDVQ